MKSMRFFSDIYERVLLTILSLTSPSSMPKETLMSIFRLADMWLLDEIRAATLTRLQPHFSSSSPLAQIEKLQFATRYNVPSWTIDACMDLATRPSAPSPCETAELGPNISFALMAARESIMRRRMRIAFGSESRWRCSGGETARSRGCARQILTSFRGALMAEISQEGCVFNVDGESITLGLTVSFSDAWREIMAVLRLRNRSRNPGLCDACVKSFGGGDGPGANLWVDHNADIEIVRREMRL